MTAPRGDFARPPAHRRSPECTTAGCPNPGTVSGTFVEGETPYRVTYCATCADVLDDVFTPDPPAAHGRDVDPGRVERVARAIASEAVAVTLETDDEWDFYLRPDEQDDYRRMAVRGLEALAADTDEAQQAVDRVRALADEWEQLGSRYVLESGTAAVELRAALDGTR